MLQTQSLPSSRVLSAKKRLSFYNLELDNTLRHGKDQFVVTQTRNGRTWKFYSMREVESFEQGYMAGLDI